MSDDLTKEPQYQICVELRDQNGLARLGLMSSQVWHDDPKRLAFTLARYKFAAKMFAGRGRVLEVGCADAFGTRIVQQDTGSVTAVDFDPVFIADAKERSDSKWPLDARVHDILEGPVEPRNFDAAFSLDTLEHIPRENEALFMKHIAQSLSEHGALIVGIPSLESQKHASQPSKEGHVNCKSGAELRKLMEQYFHNVFLFSMNDEVVHTGFQAMAHYLLALCCGKKPDV